MALETFFQFANRPGVEQVRQNQIQAQLDRKMANEAAQRNAIAELLANRSAQLANTQTALEMANYGNDKYGNPVQLQDGSYGQPVFNRQGQFLRFEKLPGYTPRSEDKTYGDPILLQDGTYGQPKLNASGQVVGITKIPGYTPRSKEKEYGDPILLQDGTYGQPQLNASGQVVGITKIPGYTPMGTTKPDYELATYLSEAEQLEFTNPSTPPERMRQLTTKAQVAKRRVGAQPTFEEKEQIKADIKRSGDLSSGAGLRETSLTEAKRFLGAFEGNEADYESFGLSGPADSGQTQSLLEMAPGKFSAQSKFNEQLDAFAEQAARQLLKAAGEVRPTDADVAGAKKALFGVGKDESTNIRLLKNYIAQQEQLEAEAKRLAKNNGSRFIIEEID